jgi:murein DD-endopeptidase MepM/ murein hydrolase activator NlpD
LHVIRHDGWLMSGARETRPLQLFRSKVSALSFVALIAITGAGLRAEVPSLEVWHHARAVEPGEIVVIEVRPSELVVAVQATAFGATIRFFSDGATGVWRGIVGIDLEARPDDYIVAVRATLGNGDTVHATYALSVASKDFQTRHLSVNPSFVNPPADILDRIGREASRQQKIFQTSSAARQWEGGFLRPVGGDSTSSFGRRSVYNGEPRSPHSGTDFRAGEGTPISAPNAGTVVLTGDTYFSGNVIIIDHGWGLYSYFAHLSSIDVVEGETVVRGQWVGNVGATGRVTGPHLHWTVRLNEARVDPLSLMALFSFDPGP